MSEVELSASAVDALNKILAHAQQVGGVVGISSMGRDDWSVAYHFGHEAPDSPMAGGAAYAVANELEEAVIGVAKQTGLV